MNDSKLTIIGVSMVVCVLIAVACTLVISNHVTYNKYMEDCQKDLKYHECIIAWRSSEQRYNTTPIVLPAR